MNEILRDVIAREMRSYDAPEKISAPFMLKLWSLRNIDLHSLRGKSNVAGKRGGRLDVYASGWPACALHISVTISAKESCGTI